MKYKPWWIIPVTIVLLVGLWSAQEPVKASPTVQDSSEVEDIQDVEEAVREALALVSDREPLFLLGSVGITETRISLNNLWALSYLFLKHPDTGEILPTEPGLVVLQNRGGEWNAALPGDAEWTAFVDAVPVDLLDPDAKSYWLEVNRIAAVNIPDAALTGYLLPWEGGKLVSLSGSVSHDQWVTSGSAHYAFDFYISGTMFPVVASKSGTVHMIRESQPDYDSTTPGNYVVLKDTETNTYQLYLHLAYDSVPDDLEIGDFVHQGQFLGIADDTGASTGHHLHFMVHQTSTSYWGTSVDIVFHDVPINGGHPRVKNDWYDDEPYCWDSDVCENFQTSYISGNVGDESFPIGKLSTPVDWSVVSSSPLSISGTATDSGVGLKSAQLMAFYSNSWHNIGPAFTTSPFSYSFDLCKAGIADGPLSIGLRLVDNAGNITPMADLVHVQKDYACPLTSLPVLGCIPGANEVSLYASPGWQGVCVKYPVGVYTGAGLGSLGDNNAASLQVGANVQATLYVDADLEGRAEAFRVDDGNMDDNLIGVDKVSGLKVALRAVPGSPPLAWPGEGQTIAQGASLNLYWENPGGASEYQARLMNLDSNSVITSTWQSEPFWHLGTGLDNLLLVTGSFEWQVRARNEDGASEWSSLRAFYIDGATLITPEWKVLPFADSFETTTNGWVGTGLWTWTNTRPAHSGVYTWWWGESAAGDEHYFAFKHGDLTSPPIKIDSGQPAYLRFSYRYQTETSRRFWDQRWVQINVDGGPFFNVYQLQEDPMNAASVNPDWMLSPYIDLGAYAGHTVRLRFHFDTMDPSGAVPDNDYDGWSIDDVSLTTTGPAACDAVLEESIDVIPNNGATGAEICAPGDIDLFGFTALAGEQLVADIDAYSEGSPLDGYLFVLDRDGTSALVENDDQRIGFYDPLVNFTAPHDGQYYLKIRAWDHGRTGGPEVDYTLSLHSGDYIEPVVEILSPPDFTWVSGNPVMITARVLETGSGVDRVEFYWHSGNWLNGVWEKLDDPIQSGDQWITTIDPGSEGDYLASIYVIVYDNVGLVGTDISWNVTTTISPPTQNYFPVILR